MIKAATLLKPTKPLPSAALPAVYLNTYITNLIADFRDAKVSSHLDSGHALFAEYEEGHATTHAHPVDQWQVYVSGVAKLAKKPVQLVTIQYTDAWVPYGPIEVTKEGFALLALWPKPNDETYEMPKDANTIREHLRAKPRRIIFKHLDVANEETVTSEETVLMQEDAVWARAGDSQRRDTGDSGPLSRRRSILYSSTGKQLTTKAKSIRNGRRSMLVREMGALCSVQALTAQTCSGHSLRRSRKSRGIILYCFCISQPFLAQPVS